MGHEHSTGQNYEQQQATPEERLRALVEQRGIFYKVDDKYLDEPVMVSRRDFWNPEDDRRLRLERLGNPRGSFTSWKVSIYPPRETTFIVSASREVQHYEESPEYVFEIDDRDETGQEQLFQEGSDMPLGSVAAEGLAKTVLRSMPIGNTQYFFLRPDENGAAQWQVINGPGQEPTPYVAPVSFTPPPATGPTIAE